MGGCFSVSLPCDQAVNQVIQWLCVKASYINDIEKNLTALEATMEELKAMRDDLLRRVEREENRGLQRLAFIQVWLSSIETIESEVNGFLSDKIEELQRLCFSGFCSKNFKLSYHYGKQVFMKLAEVENLKSKGVFEVVAEQAQASEVVERPLVSKIIGQETVLEKAWNSIIEDGVGMLGLYGMGGVGKTTLLEQINNKFKGKGFDVVIWVVVSKDLQIQKNQEDVAKKLRLDGEDWNRKNIDEKACDIHSVLRRKKFVLLLDDIWAKVDLKQIGVPFPNRENGSKVVFTTRSKEVCGRMGVDDPIEVRCLSPEVALELFRQKVGETTLRSHPDIPELAKVVAKKCHGLPLALNVIGETMSFKRTIEEWHRAVAHSSKTMEEMKVLEHLDILTISINSDSGLNEFLNSQYSMCCTEDLEIKRCQLESSDIWCLARMEKLRRLTLNGCTICEIKMDTASITREMVSPLQNLKNAFFLSLSQIKLTSCRSPKDLTWLMFAPNLTVLVILVGKEVEEIINKEKACECEASGIVPFQKLEYLYFFNLPELKNLYWRPLPFPCLTEFIVRKCPKLRKLPLNSKSGGKGLIVKYEEREWIEEVEWEDEATKARFLPSSARKW